MEKEITEMKERLEKLEKAVFGAGTIDVVSTVNTPALDFSLNERAFIKRYSAGFNGQEFFTLIAGYLSGGKDDVPVDLLKIKSVWKSCSGMIGVPYASTFSTRAKENGWVDSSRETRASYVLGKHWKDIFKKHGKNS
ncbi:MAG: hypothetical protein Q8Q38_01755 [bacterium]|nr:hypothetical protein [bacterium]